MSSQKKDDLVSRTILRHRNSYIYSTCLVDKDKRGVVHCECLRFVLESCFPFKKVRALCWLIDWLIGDEGLRGGCRASRPATHTLLFTPRFLNSLPSPPFPLNLSSLLSVTYFLHQSAFSPSLSPISSLYSPRASSCLSLTRSPPLSLTLSLPSTNSAAQLYSHCHR